MVSELDLHVVNTGVVPTCVRPQRQSAVDLTIASSWVVD